MHRVYTSDRGDTSSTNLQTKYRVRACADITRKRGHLSMITPLDFEAGDKAPIQHLQRFAGHDFL